LSLSDLEAEARKVIEEAEKRAKEVIEEAMKEARVWRTKKIEKPLNEDEIREVIDEFKDKIQKAVKDCEQRKKLIEKNYGSKKREIVEEIVRAVAGV